MDSITLSGSGASAIGRTINQHHITSGLQALPANALKSQLKDNLECQRITLDILENFLLWNVDPLQSFSDLLLPQGHEVIERVGVCRGPDVEDLVQGPRVIHSSDGIGCYVFLLGENSCTCQGIKR